MPLDYESNTSAYRAVQRKRSGNPSMQPQFRSADGIPLGGAMPMAGGGMPSPQFLDNGDQSHGTDPNSSRFRANVQLQNAIEQDRTSQAKAFRQSPQYVAPPPAKPGWEPGMPTTGNPLAPNAPVSKAPSGPTEWEQQYAARRSAPAMPLQQYSASDFAPGDLSRTAQINTGTNYGVNRWNEIARQQEVQRVKSPEEYQQAGEAAVRDFHKDPANIQRIRDAYARNGLDAEMIAASTGQPITAPQMPSQYNAPTAQPQGQGQPAPSMPVPQQAPMPMAAPETSQPATNQDIRPVKMPGYDAQSLPEMPNQGIRPVRMPGSDAISSPAVDDQGIRPVRMPGSDAPSYPNYAPSPEVREMQEAMRLNMPVATYRGIQKALQDDYNEKHQAERMNEAKIGYINAQAENTKGRNATELEKAKTATKAQLDAASARGASAKEIADIKAKSDERIAALRGGEANEKAAKTHTERTQKSIDDLDKQIAKAKAFADDSTEGQQFKKLVDELSKVRDGLAARLKHDAGSTQQPLTVGSQHPTGSKIVRTGTHQNGTKVYMLEDGRTVDAQGNVVK